MWVQKNYVVVIRGSLFGSVYSRLALQWIKSKSSMTFVYFYQQRGCQTFMSAFVWKHNLTAWWVFANSADVTQIVCQSILAYKIDKILYPNYLQQLDRSSFLCAYSRQVPNLRDSSVDFFEDLTLYYSGEIGFRTCLAAKIYYGTY